jgi:DNA-binding NtrC family response regulator
LNLLIGESQSFLAESYYEKLTNLGHRVAMCKEGKECIDKYQESLKESPFSNNSLDIVIVDELINNGLETIDEILSINPKQKVLFITNHKSIFAPKTSNISIIEKPFTMYGMIQQLEELEIK